MELPIHWADITTTDTIAVNSVNPETRSDPIPPKMDWNDSKSGRPVEKLRFIR